jgi:hypothetical protein
MEISARNGVYDKGFHERQLRLWARHSQNVALHCDALFGWNFRDEATSFLDLPILEAAILHRFQASSLLIDKNFGLFFGYPDPEKLTIFLHFLIS